MASVYEAAGGDAGLLRLAEAWHARVMADEVVSHAFSHGFQPDHTQRLAAYWAEALGGPTTYSEHVRRRDLGRADPQRQRRRTTRWTGGRSPASTRPWTTSGSPSDETLRTTLHDYFAWATTTTMAALPRDPPTTSRPVSASRAGPGTGHWEGASMAVRVDLNISLDGFATTTDQTPENPFGDDWSRLVAAYAATRTFRERVLHDTSGEGTTGVDDEYAQAYFAEVGAEIMGAGMFGLHNPG